MIKAMIKAQKWHYDYSVEFILPDGFAKDDSEKAVIRKIRRMAIKRGLIPFDCWWKVLAFHASSKKDANRVKSVLEYANGKAVRKTAMNNYGRCNARR